MSFVIRVTQLEARLSDGEDQVALPAGDGGQGSFLEYEIEAESTEAALDEFHRTHAIGCLEDFDITSYQKLRATLSLIERARELYGSTEIEIDDNAYQSPAPQSNGTWVSAWVWVPDVTPADEEAPVE